MLRVVVGGKVPPPVGGQNINIERILGLFSTLDAVEAHYWEWGFTQDWKTRNRFGLRKALEFVRAIGRLIKLRSSGRLDFILYSTGGPSRLAIIRDLCLLPWAWFLGRKVCIYFQAAGIARYQTQFSPVLNWLNRTVHRLCWGAIVITEYGAEDAKALGIENITVLPYGIEDRYPEDDSGEMANKRDDVPVILNVGHLSSQKGVPQLVAACGELNRMGFEFSLQFAGEFLAPYREEQLLDDVERAGISKRTEYLGLLDGERLWRAYRDADIFVFSSVAPYESFGLAMLEAMMMGLPVVVTDWRANADVLGRAQPAGGVITSEDEDLPLESRLLDALATAFSKQELWRAWGLRNRRRYLQEFSIEAYRARWEEFFSSIA